MNSNYEWHDKKAADNEEKHGISFITASSVFDDKDSVTFETKRKDYKEIRNITIGLVLLPINVGVILPLKILIFVVWTLRGPRKRIISARPAKDRDMDKGRYG